ncbi:MAG TPA: hypothetical protein DCZ43_06985 [candidate division Zixibacteria bacterium]|nr:hypothetical protein [candidate division Zixibacteria bacterium]
MKMRIFFCITAIVCLTGLFLAQPGVAQKTDNYILTTNPAGATAYFCGEYSLVVNTPAALPSNLSGQYKVRIARPGYETWKGELSFLPGSPNSVNINLSPKTRFKAGLRSLFIPGWGQHYEGCGTRGTAFTLGIIGAGTLLYISDRKYQDRRGDYDIANYNYTNATSITQREQLMVIRDAAQRKAYKAETDRRRVFYAGIGIWVYNIFDSMIFFPEGSAYYPTVTADNGGGAKLSLVVKF